MKRWDGGVNARWQERIRPVPHRHATVRHEPGRLIYAVLRDAPGPMTTRELTKAVMATTLRKLKNRCKVVAEKREGKTNVGRWRDRMKKLENAGVESQIRSAQRRRKVTVSGNS